MTAPERLRPLGSGGERRRECVTVALPCDVPGTATPERATVVSTWQDLSCLSDRMCPRNGGFNDLNVARIRPTVPNPGTCRSLSALRVVVDNLTKEGNQERCPASTPSRSAPGSAPSAGSTA